jgi:3-dehydroquinate dehydratase/shikimate dehydrogenase
MFELLRDAERPTIALCMGELGEVSRVLAPKFEGFLTYASLEPGAETASGQLPASELVELYHYHDISPRTEVYGVIGNPIAHSVSPDILNAAFHSEGIDAVYVRFKVEDVVGFVEAFKAIPVKGYSVTIPHKEAVIPALDSLEETSRRIGAINTIVSENGELKGSNTDWLAAVSSIEEELGGEPGSALPGKRCVMVGAGGAARAIAYGLDSRGAKLVILNRTESRARKLAAEVGCDWKPCSQLLNLDADIIINATRVGMYPDVDETPVPADFLRPGMLAFDVVYNPAETRFLKEARARGCAVVSGIDMFVGQAVAQFELWTGKAAPRGLMREVVCRKLLGR